VLSHLLHQDIFFFHGSIVFFLFVLK
jgi:hypothetical protein